MPDSPAPGLVTGETYYFRNIYSVNYFYVRNSITKKSASSPCLEEMTSNDCCYYSQKTHSNSDLVIFIYYYFQNHVKIGVKGKTSSLRHDKEIKLLKVSSYLLNIGGDVFLPRNNTKSKSAILRLP